SEDHRHRGGPRPLRPLDAGAADRLHRDALPEPAHLRALTMPLPDPTTFLLVLARVAGLVVAAPVLGHTLVPVRIRAGLAALVALALAPALGRVAEPPTLWALAGAVAVESALGAVVGLVAQLVLAGVELGGQVAGIPMGFGMASVFDP